MILRSNLFQPIMKAVDPKQLRLDLAIEKNLGIR